MGQIIGGAAKPKRCNLNKLSQLGTPAAGEYILVSSDNSMNAAGQGNFDCYIVGNGKTDASALTLRSLADAIPTKGSNNSVSSGGVHNALSQLGQEVDSIKGAEYDVSLNLTWVNDGKSYVNPSVNALTEGQNGRHVDAYDISSYAGQVLKIYLSFRSDNASRYCFITDNEYVTLTSLKETAANYPQEAGGSLYVGTMNIPSDAKYLYMTARSPYDASAKVEAVIIGELDLLKASSVQYTSQIKTSEEKQIARNNIDAISKNDLDGLKGYNIINEPFPVTWINDGAVYTNAFVESLTGGQDGKHADAIDVSRYVGGSIKVCLSYIVEQGASRYSFISGNDGDLRWGIRESLESFPYNSDTQLYEATLNVPFGSKYMYLSARKNANASVYVSYRAEGLDDIVDDNLIKTTILEVGPTKSFRNIVYAIKSITDSSYLNRYEIHIFEGTYDTVVEDEIDENYVGLVIPDWVSLIGIGSASQIVLRGICPSGYEAYANNISTINFMANGRIENLTIYAKNLRYGNHDDNILFVDSYHSYKQVRFVVDTTDAGFNVAACGIGIGSQQNKKVDFIGCTFINNNNAIMSNCGLLMHDVNGRNGIIMSLDCCKFVGGYYNIWIGNNGNSAKEAYILLKGNIFDGSFYVSFYEGVTTNKFNFRGYANKGLTFAEDSVINENSPDWQVI